MGGVSQHKEIPSTISTGPDSDLLLVPRSLRNIISNPGQYSIDVNNVWIVVDYFELIYCYWQWSTWVNHSNAK